LNIKNNGAQAHPTKPHRSSSFVICRVRLRTMRRALFAPLWAALLMLCSVQAQSATPAATPAWSAPDKTPSSVFKSAKKDLVNFGAATTTPDFWHSMALVGGISLVSAVADRPLDRYALNHGRSGIMRDVKNVGNVLPFAAIAYSATMFLASDPDSKPARTAYSSLAAGGLGAMTALGLKYMVGRARPSAEKGSASFTPVNIHNGDTSWPSMHTTVMWAVITPYAKAYDAPWLYGVAAVTNASRVIGRDHWFSDTVAGSLLGYAIGNFIWTSHQGEQGGAQWLITPNRVAVNWKFD